MANVPISEIMQLRGQGLTDDLISTELQKRGIPINLIQAALEQISPGNNSPSSPPPQMQRMPPQQQAENAPNIYERIEEIAESMIDEKWDDLIHEVKKIVEWKEKIEERQSKINNDIEKLKEDFKILHQGVLGKIEDSDKRMRDVGTELKAVGKVFKDVVPEFVENVKELKDITQKSRKK
jgi:hypothetical protein